MPTRVNDNEARPGDEPGLWLLLYRGTMFGSVVGGSFILVGSLFAALAGFHDLDCTLAGLGLLAVGFGGLALW